MRDGYVFERLGEVGQGRGDDLFCFPGSECAPAFCLADEVDGADTPVVEAAVPGQRWRQGYRHPQRSGIVWCKDRYPGVRGGFGEPVVIGEQGGEFRAEQPCCC